MYILQKEKLCEVCKELGLPADKTVETMKALMAKWVDNSKDDKMKFIYKMKYGTEQSDPCNAAGYPHNNAQGELGKLKA